MNLEIQHKQLMLMLKEIKSILKDIDFFLIGGSALGAVRHKGFIPWDDDIDIAVYRKDFARAEELLRTSNSRIIEYFSIGNNIYQKELIGRVYLKEELNTEKKPKTVIDFFPIDNVPNNNILRIIHYILIRFYRIFCNKQPVKNRGKIVEVVINMLFKILPNSIANILSRFGYRSMVFFEGKTKYVANIFGAKGYFAEIMPIEYIGNLTQAEFEGDTYLIPEQWGKYLTHLYGDYMKLPDEEDRKPKHIEEVL